MKDFFKAPRLCKDDVGELVFCLVTMFLVFGFSRKLPSLELTEEELLLLSLVFATFVGVWGCFFCTLSAGRCAHSLVLSTSSLVCHESSGSTSSSLKGRCPGAWTCSV